MMNVLRSSGVMGVVLRAAGVKKSHRDLVDAGDDPDAIAEVLRRRRRLDQATPPAYLNTRFNVESNGEYGFPLHLLRRKAGASRAILYFHGGGFVLGPTLVQWAALASIAHRSECDLIVVDYPKAPESQAMSTLDATADSWLFATERYGAENIVVAGDSSGATLALSLMVELAALGEGQPALALLMSPLLDVALSHPGIEAVEELDHMLDREGVLRDLRLWRGNLEASDTRISPGLASVDGLAPTHIYAGTHELLYPDIADYVQRGQEAGSPMWLTEADGGQHVWPLFSTPSGSRARREMVRLIDGVFLGVS